MDAEKIEHPSEDRHDPHREQKTVAEEVNEMAKPLLDINCITEPSCDYPVAVRILMDDGTVQTYGLENKMEMQFAKVMNSLEKLTVGYQYKPTRKNRIHRSERWTRQTKK